MLHPSSSAESHALPFCFAELLLNPAVGARRTNVPAGKVLYDPADPARHLYFVHRGQVRTFRMSREDDAGRLLEILGPDGWCGEASLARQPRYGEQAVAVVPSVVSEVLAERLVAALPHHVKSAVELLKQLADKLAAAREDATELVFQDCQQRLLKTLVRFSGSAAAAPHPDGVVLRITHHQLAQAVGVARETVSLALTQLRQKNLLRTGRNQLMFNPEDLRSLQDRRVSSEAGELAARRHAAPRGEKHEHDDKRNGPPVHASHS